MSEGLKPLRDGILREAQFLCDRLDSLEWADDGYADVQREYFGHVEPSHARLKALLSATPEWAGREVSPERQVVDRLAARMGAVYVPNEDSQPSRRDQVAAIVNPAAYSDTYVARKLHVWGSEAEAKAQQMRLRDQALAKADAILGLRSMGVGSDV